MLLHTISISIRFIYLYIFLSSTDRAFIDRIRILILPGLRLNSYMCVNIIQIRLICLLFTTAWFMLLGGRRRSEGLKCVCSLLREMLLLGLIREVGD